MGTAKLQEWKGYLFALAGTVSFSSLYIFSKAGLNHVGIVHFGLCYFGLGFLINLIFVLLTGKFRQIKGVSSSVWLLLIALGLVDIANNFTFFKAIQVIPDPSVTSFLGNLFPVYLSLLGVIFLKERFGLFEALGASMAIVGAFVVGYTGDLGLNKLFVPGVGWVVVNTFLAAIVSLIIKKNVTKTSPEIFNLNSNGWIFLFFLAWSLNEGQPISIPPVAFVNIALGAFFGAFLGLLLFYYSYRYIEASKSSVVQSLKGIFVLGIAWLSFGTLPTPIQLWGGMITVAGVLLMTLSQAGFIRKRK